MIRKPSKRKLKLCGYSECKKEFLPQRPLQVACSIECARKFNEEKEVEKRARQMESNVTKLSVLEGLAKTVIQKWVRLRDAHLPCISCGTWTTEQWDGGHYMKAELYSGVIFHPLNINKQCCYCNGPYMDGNTAAYRIGLVKKIGEEKVQELEVLAVKTKKYKFTREELTEIIKKYKLKIKNGDFTND